MQEEWMQQEVDGLVTQYGMVPPPWVVYQEHPYSICWRMGGGETHLMVWREWWPQQAFTEDQKIAYFRRWPPPYCWLPLLIEAIWQVDTFAEDDEVTEELALYFGRTSALGFGGQADYERDLDDPKWFRKDLDKDH
jgi:hypothetical protein